LNNMSELPDSTVVMDNGPFVGPSPAALYASTKTEYAVYGNRSVRIAELSST